MNKTFQIKAQISLLKENGREGYISTGYRPAFDFGEKSLTSGAIFLLNTEKLDPREKDTVFIHFISHKLLGDIKEGTNFSFFEGKNKIGEGTVLNVIGYREHRQKTR